MKKIAVFLLLCTVWLSTGCPQKIVKTKPSTKLGQNQLVTQINSFLENRQMAYYCAMTGRYVNYNFTDFSFKKTYSCGKQRNTDGGIVINDDKLLAKRIRDETIENGVMAVNSVYTDFIDDLNTGRDVSNFAADVIDLGTSAAIGVSKGERALQVLGVALTAFRGGRKSADLNFFREQATPVLINKMDDNRATVYASILLKKNKSVDEYPMTEAIKDIVDYYNAGTLIKAFTQLSKETGNKALESEKKVLQIQKIDPDDIVLIDNVDAHVQIKDFLQQYKNIFKPDSQVSAEGKKAATENLKLIYRTISKDSAITDTVKKAKADNPTLADDMTKLEAEDETKAEDISGQTLFNIISAIYRSIDLETDGALAQKIADHFNKHQLKD